MFPNAPGAPDPMALMYQQFITAPDEESRYPFLGDGTHDLILANYLAYNSKQNGYTIKAEFLVVSSTNPAHAPGSFATKMWQPQKQVKNFPTFGEREVARARKFIGTLMHGQALNGVVIDGQNPEQTTQVVWFLLQNKDSNPARGVAIRCHGSSTTAKPGELTTSGQPKKGFTEHTWEHVPGQVPQGIMEWRAKVDQILGAQAPVQPGPHAATQPQYAPPQYQQPAAAPSPAQLQQGYGVNPQAQQAQPMGQPGFGQPAANPFGGAPAQPAANPFGGAPAQPAANSFGGAPGANPFGGPKF